MKQLYVFCLLSVGFAIPVHAQPSSSSPWSNEATKQTFGTKPPPPPPSPTPTDAPLDGGLCALLVAGALYGKRAYNGKHAAAKQAASL